MRTLLFLSILPLCLLISCKKDNTAAATTPPPAEITDGYLRLTSGPLEIAVDPNVGGRIASFTYEGTEILKTSRDTGDVQWGSTVWTSPQSDWGWPPNPVFDKSKYTIAAEQGNRIVLVSDFDRETGLQITKSIRLAEDERWGHVATLRYQVYNRGEAPVQVGAWENTRVPFDGSMTFPAGKIERLGNPEKAISTGEQEGLLTLNFDGNQPGKQKIFFTPEAVEKGRYISHTYRNNGLVFTKNWKPSQQIAPEQSGLEIYLAPDDGFAELEIQGPYINVPPAGRAELTVLWQLAKEK